MKLQKYQHLLLQLVYIVVVLLFAWLDMLRTPVDHILLWVKRCGETIN